MKKVSLRGELARITDHWRPRIAAEVNDTHVKLAKVKGEFEWHRHADEDELFLVVTGHLLLQFRDRDIWLGAGEMLVVPRGVEHRPIAPEEVELVLIEPRGTRNTGDKVSDLTVEEPDWI